MPLADRVYALAQRVGQEFKAVRSEMAASSVPAGTIVMTARTSAPAGWLLCDGSNVSRSTYLALFNAISTNYGTGDGSSTFTLPNLVSRVPRGANGALGTLYGGANTVAISQAHLPAHSHTINHDHGLTVAGGAHDHVLTFSSATGSAQSNVPRGTTTQAGQARGAVVNDGSHQHTVNAFSGSSGNGPGTGSLLDVTNLYTSVNYLIKT